ALNAYVTESFIENSRIRQQGDEEDFLLCAFVLRLTRGSRRAPAPAPHRRARDAPGTPPKRGCPRAHRPRRLPSGPPSRLSPPKSPTREATIPLRSRDTPSPQRPSPRRRRPFAPCPPPPRRLRLQTRSPSART